MIFRITQKLNKKIKAGQLSAVPLGDSAWGDWSARLFTANRKQYILLTHTASLYSIVMSGRGITNDRLFGERAAESIREFMMADRLGLMYTNFIAPELESVRFGKSLNRSVTGSMNDYEAAAKFHLATDEISLFETGCRLNETPMSGIKTPGSGGYGIPRDTFKRIR